jgi:excisionase family DNA binding protein
MPSQFYSVKEAAHVLNMAAPTVYRKVYSGDIPSVRIGRRQLIPVVFVQQLIDRAMAKKPAPVFQEA